MGSYHRDPLPVIGMKLWDNSNQYSISVFITLAMSEPAVIQRRRLTLLRGQPSAVTLEVQR